MNDIEDADDVELDKVIRELEITSAKTTNRLWWGKKIYGSRNIDRYVSDLKNIRSIRDEYSSDRRAL